MTTIVTPSYTKHAWVNSGGQDAIPINAERLNQMEQGIYDGVGAAGDLIAYTDDIDSVLAALHGGYYEGRNLLDTPEFSSELQSAGSIQAMLISRAEAGNFKGLRIHDYVPDVNSQNMAYEIGMFDLYYGAGDTARKHHIGMAPLTTWPSTVVWRVVNNNANNNGTLSEKHPYLVSDLHAYESSTILASFSSAWQNVMQTHRVLLEERYSSSGNLTAASSWSWADLGKIFSLSETEVYGQCVWGTPNGYSIGYDAQWPCFARTADRIRTYDGTNRANWWLRTPHGTNAAAVCYVSYGGGADGSSAAYTNIRPLPCFLIGAN